MIYSCPSSSPIKDRMVYASGVSSAFTHARSLLPAGSLANRKVETSDPGELDEAYLKSELGIGEGGSTPVTEVEEKKAFARPKGPGRRR